MFDIHEGSILDCDVDVIVNPANSFMNHAGGLARVIDTSAQMIDGRVERCNPDSPHSQIRAVGRYQQKMASAPLVPTGDIFVTPAGALPFKRIIHAVGPIWGGGSFCEKALLRSVFGQALAYCYNAKFETIAFPAISAGIFGVPIDVVADCAITALSGARMRKIVFALTDPEHVRVFQRELA